jgi:hypothetical protein
VAWAALHLQCWAAAVTLHVLACNFLLLQNRIHGWMGDQLLLSLLLCSIV